MSLWGQIFAAGYDRLMAPQERTVFGPHRRQLLARVSGRVLEIGGGTGANLPHYGTGVTELVITEPEEPMARRLRAKLVHHSLPARVMEVAAEQLPFEDHSFDFVVSTLVLCTVSDPAQALREINRLLKTGGQLIFLEHVRSDEPGLARWQDRLNFVQLRIGHGCNCNRSTVANIEGAGFDVFELERDELRRAPPIVKPIVFGAARPRQRS